MKKVKILIISLIFMTGCTAATRVINPFYEPPSDVALKGQVNDHALNESRTKADTARSALEHMSTYQAASAPQPVNPVIQPAIVRVMWIPDHLNSHGDLIPAHYYYLKVLDERWAVTDAFELESQLNKKGGNSNLPYIYK